MISKFLGAVVVGSLILPVPTDAGSAVGKTNAGGKYVHYGRTNPGGKWLELWYQPKIETRALVMRGAEALSRVRVRLGESFLLLILRLRTAAAPTLSRMP